MVLASTRLRALAPRYPLAFAALWFVIQMGLLRVPSVFPSGSEAIGGVATLVLSLLVALALLAWLGWLQDAGFNGPERWRDLRVLWLPALVALFTLAPVAFTLRFVSTGGAVVFAVMYALLTAASEEAMNRGLILQTLRPNGPVAAVLLSALFFGLAHLNNVFTFGLSLFVLAQVFWSFLMGVAYAAFRLRTNTIWLLVALHACNDIAIDISLFATARGASRATNLSSGGVLISALVLIGLNLVLAGYGLFLLRPRSRSATSGPIPDTAVQIPSREPQTQPAGERRRYGNAADEHMALSPTSLRPTTSREHERCWCQCIITPLLPA